MKILPLVNRLLLHVLLVALPGAGSLASQDYGIQDKGFHIEIEPDQSTAQSQQALMNAQTGDFGKALDIAHGGLEKCPTGVSGIHCRALLNYTLGYVFQQQARGASPGTEREHPLNAASDSYNAALEDDPNNAAIRYNLALVLSALGKTDAAVTELERSVQNDPQNWQYMVKLGDLYGERQNWAGALQEYQRAAQAAPGAEAPLQRLLALTSIRHGVAAAELESDCEKWETLHPRISRACYELFIRTVCLNDRGAAEAALVRWLEIVARLESLDEHFLDPLPTACSTPALAPLRQAVRGELPDPSRNWWSETAPRREAWARFLLVIGEQVSPPVPPTTERIWLSALAQVKSNPSSGASLELRRALALLYVQHPEDDPDHRKLQQLVEQIFVGKMQAIRSNDLEAQQRYHSALGLIFADEQAWGSDYDAHGAIFQLTSTLEVANERYRAEGIYQPLPEIRELLAHVYEKTDRPRDAAKLHWDAVLAYMDSDQLERAGRALESIQVPEGFDRQELNALLKVRRDANDMDGTRGSYVIGELLTLQPSNGIPADFLERQQFKTLADVAKVGPVSEGVSVQAAMKAFSLAMEQHVPLIGVNDLGRWQAVQRQLVDSVGGRSEVPVVRPAGPGGSAELKLSLPGTTVAQTVLVSPSTMQAAHVAQVLGPNRLASFGHSLIFTSGELSVPDQAQLSPEIRQQLELNGVKVVAGTHSQRP